MVDFGVESVGQSECMGQQRHKILWKIAFFFFLHYQSVMKIIFRFLEFLKLECY